MRALAETVKDEKHRAIMLRLADDYDLLGDRAAIRAEQSSSKSQTSASPQRQRVGQRIFPTSSAYSAKTPISGQ
jgi:hypothetical protein